MHKIKRFVIAIYVKLKVAWLERKRRKFVEAGRERVHQWVIRQYPAPDFELIRKERLERLEQERKLAEAGLAKCDRCGACFEVAKVKILYFILRLAGEDHTGIQPVICPGCTTGLTSTIDSWWREERKHRRPKRAVLMVPDSRHTVLM